MFDKRFARQHCFGPPPDFRLASSCTGIVRNLSGPNQAATARGNRNGDHGPCCRPKKGLGTKRFRCAGRFHYLTTCGLIRLLGPCYKTGGSNTSTETKKSSIGCNRMTAVSPKAQESCTSSAPTATNYSTQPKGAGSKRSSPLGKYRISDFRTVRPRNHPSSTPIERQKPVLSCMQKYFCQIQHSEYRRRQKSHSAVPFVSNPTKEFAEAARLRTLPRYRFQVLLTLFSKFFATFPHGTCVLSDSDEYLALTGTHLPLYTVLSNSVTRGTNSFEMPQPAFTGLSPSLALYSNKI